jgi:hypothetical protein
MVPARRVDFLVVERAYVLKGLAVLDVLEIQKPNMVDEVVIGKL